MKKIYLLLQLCGVFISQHLYTLEPLHEKIFFANSLMTKNFFYSETTYTSPSQVKNAQRIK